ncbi:Mo-dependent nitrogenase C-terminal domain-containing protein [Nodularia sp. UHCC 0506]
MLLRKLKIINTLYKQLVSLRFKAFRDLDDECGGGVTTYN